MKFTVNSKILADAAAHVSRAAKGKQLAGQAALLTLNGTTLTMSARDDDLGIARNIEVTAGSDGKTAVPARLFSEVVTALPGNDVVIDIKDAQMSIDGGRSSFSINCIDVDQVTQPTVPDGAAVEVDGNAFTRALARVRPAVSRDANRQILTGIFVEKTADGIRFVATDSYRLAYMDMPGADTVLDSDGVILPHAVLDEVAKIADGPFQMVLGERGVAFHVGSATITSSVISGDYPKYRGLIPNGYTRVVTVDREDLIGAIERVRTVNDDATPMRLAVAADGLQLQGTTQGVGSGTESIDADVDGEDITVGFNPSYLVTALKNVKGEKAHLNIVDALKPATITGDDDYLHLLMPVRLS